MKISIKILISLLILLLPNISNAEVSDWQEASVDKNTAKVRVLDSFYFDEKGQKNLIIGLQFNLEKGWKIYGPGSDSIGFPPTTSFKNSKNYKNHQIIWPQSIAQEEKFGDEIIKYNIYKHEVILPIEINLSDINKPTELNFKLEYGLCKEVCIPASTEFKIKIKDEIDNNSLKLIQQFLEKKITKISNNSKENIITNDEVKMPSITLISALIASFIGGLILNIMPCVLPVLGIKLISVINHEHAVISRVRCAFLATFLGIISCFILFSFFAIAIMLTGNEFNWGLQFQNPYFLIFLIIILLFLTANMMEIFKVEFNRLITNFLNKKIHEKEKNIIVPNFLSGILAVLLATPCSAPFLGAAISFSITQNAYIIFLIFTIMGIGFGLPYLILLISPNLVKRIPKSGQWTFKIRKILTSLLIATIIWLIYVLSGTIGLFASIIASILCLLFFFCFKIKYTSLKILAFGTLLITIFFMPKAFENRTKPTWHKADRIWQDFNEARLHQLVEQGNVVVVDVTANWCLTCKFNKVRVLHDQEIVDKLSEQNIIAMRADITKPNQEVINFINKKGRFAIPFNAVYGPHAKNGLLTSELLNKKELLKLIEQAS